MSPRGPAEALPLPPKRCRFNVLVSDRLWDDLLPAWARLGPFSVIASAMPGEGRCLAITQTVDRDLRRRGRSPNGVAWRFPDWTAVGFRSKLDRCILTLKVCPCGFPLSGTTFRSSPFGLTS